MANITDQFVTSFSELYIGDQLQTGKSFTFDTHEKVRGFFGPSATTVTLGDSSVTTITTGANISVTDPNTNSLVFFATTGITTIAVSEQVSLETLEATTGISFLSARVPLVMEIGTLSNEATVIDTPTFGEIFKGKLRGQLDGGQLDAQLYWAPRDFVHRKIREYAQDGTATLAGIKWTNASGAGADAEYVIFDSFVSSFGIDTAFDDVAKASATMVVDGSEVFGDDSTTGSL